MIPIKCLPVALAESWRAEVSHRLEHWNTMASAIVLVPPPPPLLMVVVVVC